MRKLYNEGIKNEYIKAKEQEGKEKAGYAFKNYAMKVAFYEEEKRKDVYDFTMYEIIDMYKIINISSFNYLYNINSALSMYVDWCIDMNIPNDYQNHFKEITSEDIKRCLNTLIASNQLLTREEILRICKDPIIPSHSYSFMILGLFEGIGTYDPAELIKMKITDIDIERKIARTCVGRELEISNELCVFAQEAAAETKYVSFNGQDRWYNYPESQQDYIIKAKRDKKEGDVTKYIKHSMSLKIIREIKQVLSLIEDEDGVPYDNYIRKPEITKSGMLDFIQKRSEELNLTAEEYYDSDKGKEELIYRYNYKSRKKVFITTFGPYLGL